MNDRDISLTRHFWLNGHTSWISCIWLLMVTAVASACSGAQACADGPSWIWSAQGSGSSSARTSNECYFRKKFTLVGPERAEIIFAAGDEYEIYLNGRLATRGQSFGKETKVDVSKLILPGVNLVAAKVRHYDGPAAGLSLKFRVKERADVRWRSLNTDTSWRTRNTAVAAWMNPTYNDMSWVAAQVIPQPIATSVGNDTVTKSKTMSAGDSATVVAKSPGSSKGTAQPSARSKEKVANREAASSAIAGQAAPADATPPIAKSAVPQIALTTGETGEGETGLSKATTIQATASPIAEPQKVYPQPPEVAPQKLRVISQGDKLAGTTPATAKPQAAASGRVVASKKQVASKAPASGKARFEIDPEFQIQQIMSGKETGSLVAMEFNEFGKLLLSREGGPLMIADVSKPVGHPARIRTYCNQVNTCQGILPLNGDVYVTASGPQGLGLYKLSDPDNDGTLTVEDKLVSFTGKLGEHGPHGIQLGPDGMLYVIIGNDSQVSAKLAETSPYQHFYEGDLVPRYEDPGGHAQGVKAPGGTIVRISLDGSKVERVAGGIRNAYDLVLDQNGEVFFHDSDMESDIGTTWYRPTMIFHAADGSEIGWRSGWAKYPEYFADQVPPVAKTGRGSPTGAVHYQHIQFPAKYHDGLFFADWSEGRILFLKPQPNGAGFVGKPETFIKGRPLNVCDMSIGEDGGLYFCTGGRGTTGGVFRVTWKGEIPESMLNFDSDLAKVIRHPQPGAAWARQNIAQIRTALGDQWSVGIEGVVRERRNSSKVRVRALQLMVLYGPAPNDNLLRELAQDSQPEVRAQIARLCGLKRSAVCEQILRDMVSDKSPYVRRVTCESCIRAGVTPTYQTLMPMLASLDRVESNAARRLLERIPAAQWEQAILQSNDNRIFINGSIALLTAKPTLQRSYQVLARVAQIMEGFVNDRDFVDLLRTSQLALAQGEVDPTVVGGLTTRIINEFPSNSSVINRELARVLGYLKAGDFEGRLESYLADAKVSPADKVHVAMFLLNGKQNLKQAERVAIVDALETARTATGTGGSYDRYVLRAIESISGSVAGNDIQTVLKNGHKWPKTVLTAFYKLPVDIDETTEQAVIDLDQRIAKSGKQDHASQQVRLGVIAILARDGGARGMDYLRQIWRQEPDRRNDIVIGLSQQPDDENWAYLISSLENLDDLTSLEVMTKLTLVNRRPRDAKHYRETIATGYRLRGEGATAAAKLIEHWSGETLLGEATPWESQLQACQAWFAKQFPEEPAIEIAQDQTPHGRYSIAQIVDQLSRTGLGNAQRGQALFAKAQCATCHRVGQQGETVGPELTNLASRFSLREAIESTIHPSAVVPDRYASKTILTVDGITFDGMTIEQPDGSYFVLLSDGKRIRVAKDDIEAMKDNPNSAMPEGLLDQLTMSQVADLFAYLMKSNATSTAATRKPVARIGAMPTVRQNVR